MRYKYKITEVNKEPEEVQAMSYKKMLKSLLLKLEMLYIIKMLNKPFLTDNKYKEHKILNLQEAIVYINKKGRKITRSF